MKMTPTEKLFVNRQGHAARVARRTLQLLSRCMVRRGQRCLEIGCGVGAAARSMAETCGLEVTGVDVDPDQIRAAQTGPENRNLHFAVMDAAKLDFPDAQFDLVVTTKTLHHVEDRQAAIREMGRVLKPGGYLVFTDFLVPAWFPVARSLAESRLAALASQAHLATSYRSRSGPAVSLIWRKEPVG
jgi:ubiquinone/menaquinone biosynthesis C-methylase UbiE